MKKLLLLIMLIFFTPVFAEVSLDNVEISQTYPIEYMDMNFLVDLNNHDANITTGTIRVFIDSMFYKSKVFSLNYYENKTFDINIPTPDEGFYSATIDIVDILPLIDENTENNSFDINFESYFGYDLHAVSISTSKSNPVPDEIITVFGTVENLGDLGTTNVNILVLANDEIVFSDTTSIDSFDNYDFIFDHSVSIGQTTFELVVDQQNEIIEADELNNTAETQVTTYSGVDLYISPGDVSYSTNTLYKNKEVEISFKVKNIGGSETQSFVTKAWSEEKENDNLLLYSTNSLGSGEEVTLSFKYIPETIGLHLFIIETDVGNVITEANENNNEIVFSKLVEVNPISGDNTSSHIVNLELFKSCKALMSNGQIFFNEGITLDGAAYVLKYRLLDGENIIMSGEVRESSEPVVEPGVTMNVITIDDDFARIMLIYQNVENVLSTDCTEDFGQLTKDLEFYKTSFNVCSADLTVEQDKYSTLNKERNTCEDRASKFQGKWLDCLDDKTTLYNSCFTDDLNDISYVQQQQTKFDKEKEKYELVCKVEVDDRDLMITILGILLTISYGAFMYYYYIMNRVKKGGY